MTTFVYVRPTCFAMLDILTEKLDLVDVLLHGTPEERQLFARKLDEHEAIWDQRYRWLARNADEINHISVQTEDTPASWENIARFYDSNGQEIYHDYIGNDRRAFKRFKNRCKKYGIPTDIIHDNGLLEKPLG